MKAKKLTEVKLVWFNKTYQVDYFDLSQNLIFYQSLANIEI